MATQKITPRAALGLSIAKRDTIHAKSTSTTAATRRPKALSTIFTQLSTTLDIQMFYLIISSLQSVFFG